MFDDVSGFIDGITGADEHESEIVAPSVQSIDELGEIFSIPNAMRRRCRYPQHDHFAIAVEIFSQQSIDLRMIFHRNVQLGTVVDDKIADVPQHVEKSLDFMSERAIVNHVGEKQVEIPIRLLLSSRHMLGISDPNRRPTEKRKERFARKIIIPTRHNRRVKSIDVLILENTVNEIFDGLHSMTERADISLPIETINVIDIRLNLHQRISERRDDECDLGKGMIALELAQERRHHDRVAHAALHDGQDASPWLVPDGLKRDCSTKFINELGRQFIRAPNIFEHVLVGEAEKIFQAALDEQLFSRRLILFGKSENATAPPHHDNFMIVDAEDGMIHEIIDGHLSKLIGLGFACRDETVEGEIEFAQSIGERRAVISDAEDKNAIVSGDKFFEIGFHHLSLR